MTTLITDGSANTVSLDKDTEQFMFWAARAGDRGARELLITSGFTWVDLHARRLGHHGSRYDDAVAAGHEALVRAVDRFDAKRGVRLVTFAWPWISRAMQPARELAPPVIDAVPESEPWDDSLLDGLTDEQARVLSLRFGFGSECAEPQSQRAVAAALGMSHWRARAVEVKAISQLRLVLDRVSHRAP